MVTVDAVKAVINAVDAVRVDAVREGAVTDGAVRDDVVRDDAVMNDVAMSDATIDVPFIVDVVKLPVNSVDAVNIPPVNVEKFVALIKVAPSIIFDEI